MVRALRPGGRLIITFPADDDRRCSSTAGSTTAYRARHGEAHPWVAEHLARGPPAHRRGSRGARARRRARRARVQVRKHQPARAFRALHGIYTVYARPRAAPGASRSAVRSARASWRSRCCAGMRRGPCLSHGPRARQAVSATSPSSIPTLERPRAARPRAGVARAPAPRAGLRGDRGRQRLLRRHRRARRASAGRRSSVVALPENVGFAAGGQPRASSARAGELVALVNNDVELHPDFLARARRRRSTRDPRRRVGRGEDARASTTAA